MGRPHHLADDRLFDCYTAERGGEPIDPPAAEHLADCAECGARFAELAHFLDGLRTDADADTDDLFPVEWRESQLQQIGRRIQHLGRAAKVISFPGRLADHRLDGSATRLAPRWAAAAAAAGLFVGLAAGMFYDFYDARTHVTEVAVSRPAPTDPAAAVTQPVLLDTDAFLSELERALGGPRTPELMSLDVLTPHVREIGMIAQ
jgi:hypothetical protein